jgi:hypothetical protein
MAVSFGVVAGDLLDQLVEIIVNAAGAGGGRRQLR